MIYRARDGHDYLFNLIDTPGHVDFTYEVSRSLAACEGAILVVDAAQGIQAQTVSNVYLAVEQRTRADPGDQQDRSAGRARGRSDARNPRPDRAREDEIVKVSAREGIGIRDLLEAIVARIPPPTGDREGKLQGADLRFASTNPTAGPWSTSA